MSTTATKSAYAATPILRKRMLEPLIPQEGESEVHLLERRAGMAHQRTTSRI